MTDNRTTELLHKLLDERGVKWWESKGAYTFWDSPIFGRVYAIANDDGTLFTACMNSLNFTPEQAISATLGKPKAKAHPYGYEPDTGAFDCTRCECGCINDISATYCNDCGGEIEVDMNAEKELYHHPRNSVFAEKHDDGSLEFGGKRYIAVTLGSGTCEMETDWDYLYDGIPDAPEDTWAYMCSACGWSFRYDRGIKPKHCPNCGAKVVKQ